MRKFYLTLALILVCAVAFAETRVMKFPSGTPVTVLDSSDSVTVSDDVYDATAWNGDTDAATKNAIRDKIEAIAGGSGDNDKASVDSGATPDYIGAASSDGVLRTDSTLDYTDGGDYVTIGIDSTLKTNYDAAYTHISSNGSDHTYIDQDVTSGSTPTFAGTNFTAMSANDVNITDSGSIITATEVEGALQENRTAINLNTTHRSSDGSDHTFIDQSVISGSTPTFTNTNFTEATDKNYVTDAEKVVIGNTSGTNTGDQDLSSYVDGSGTAGEVSFWTDADTISSDGKLFWDNTNKYLGIGTSTPSDKLSVVDGNISAQKTGVGVALVSKRTDGKAAMLQAAKTGSFFGYDNSGYFSVVAETRAHIEAGTVLSGHYNIIAFSNGSIRFNDDGLKTTALGTNVNYFKGDIGIGTTSPSEALDVVGNIAVSGTVDGIDIATDVAANTTHRSSSGSDHTYIDQSVVVGSTPTFTNTNFTDSADKRYMSDAQETVLDNTSGVNTGDQDASDIALLEIGSATYDDVQDWVNTTQSAGKISGGAITDGGSGNASVSAGTGFIKITDSDVGVTKFFDWSANGALVLSDGETNYIYVEYNSGTPQIATATSMPSDKNTNILLGLVHRDGTDLHITSAGMWAANYDKKTFFKDIEINGKFQRVSGMAISETGTRNIALTSGYIYAGLTKVALGSFDSSGADTFIYYYRDGSGGWTSVAAQSQIDNVHYDDGDGTLGSVSTSSGWRTYYGVHWVYQDADGDVFVVYGQGNYLLTAAENAQPPSTIPDLLQDIGGLVGKIIIARDASSFQAIYSAFDVNFTPSVVSNHNELSGLQGGTADEYYHLTDAEHTVVGNTSGTNTGDQDLSGYMLNTGDDVTGDYTFDTSTFAIDATNGRVGIGTTAPSVKFNYSTSASGENVLLETTDTVAGRIGFDLKTAFTANEKDYFRFNFRGDKPDVTMTIYDDSAAAFHSFIKFKYLEDQLYFGNLLGSYDLATGGWNVGYISSTANDGGLIVAGDTGLGTSTPNQKLTVEGTMDLKEQAAANADTAGYGQLWVKTATPNELWFTDDAGTDFQLGAGSTGAPTDADYLVGTANGSLSAEIVVGTSPGGELGGTWASPTIDDLFLTNTGDDTTTGTLTMAGLKVGTTNQGDILYDNGTSFVRLTPGTSGQFLKTQGAGANVTWDDATASAEVFTSSGSFTAPTGVNNIFVSICGGGGGGGAGITNDGGGGGGGAESVLFAPMRVVAGNSYTVTVGSGGSGGTYGNNDATDGGSSSIVGADFTLTCSGGSKGIAGSPYSGGAGASSSSASTLNGVNNGSGGPSGLPISTTAGGTGGNGSVGASGGGGGGSLLGSGGDGSLTSGSNGDGYGGGGGGGKSSFGGNGGGGVVIVMY